MSERMMMRRLVVTVATISLLAGCTMGQNYHRPAISSPVAFRGGGDVPAADPASLADLKWFEVFNDERLQEMIRTALVQKLRHPRRRRSRRGGARQPRHHPRRPISHHRGRRGRDQRAHLRERVGSTARGCGSDPHLWRGRTQPALVRGGRVGAAAPRDRSRAGRPACQRLQPQSGDDDARQRRRGRVLQPARVGRGAGDREAHAGSPREVAATHQESGPRRHGNASGSSAGRAAGSRGRPGDSGSRAADRADRESDQLPAR